MPLSALQLTLDGLADKVRALLPILQDGIYAVQGAVREAGRGLFKIDLFSAHSRNIDDITNYYNPHFRGYLLLPSAGLLISSIHQNGEHR